ncbi:MAG: hypothetical protein QF842_07145 [Candidatus Marinimicrobia bacterium]|jgi:hypothetical protein|nr:hypothetical protein [Candidatus Neomarinimicrobiota bacterium]|tara:strand:+ start:62849 stop:63271 length:423 start_codon:yes stop_codon:yes gene_type:complete
MDLKWIIPLFMSLGFINAQKIVFDKNPGFINIKADTNAVPIYVDGSLIGHTPLDNPIPVLEGIHYITHHPPSIQDPFLQYSETGAVKQVFVLSGDTINVHLNTYLLAEKIAQAKEEYRFSRYIWSGISFLFLWQLWILAN